MNPQEESPDRPDGSALLWYFAETVVYILQKQNFFQLVKEIFSILFS
jgi:hypothetical protein